MSTFRTAGAVVARAIGVGMSLANKPVAQQGGSSVIGVGYASKCRAMTKRCRVIEDVVDPGTIEALRFVRRQLASRRSDVIDTAARRAEPIEREPVFRLGDLSPAELRDQLLAELDAMRRSVLAERQLAAADRSAPQPVPEPRR